MLMVKSKAVETSQKRAGKENMPPVLSPAILEAQNKKALQNDPNISSKRKLR